MAEIKRIFDKILAFLAASILKYLQSTENTKVTTQEEAIAPLKEAPCILKPESIRVEKEATPEETQIIVEKEIKLKETPVIVEKEVEIQVKTPPPKIKKVLEINKQFPQDSMLRRHYLTHLKMMLEFIYAPYPTDSALKRHRETFIEAKIEDCLNDKDKLAQLVLNYEVIKTTLKQEPLIVETVAAIKVQPQEIVACNKEILPEEGIQKRHYLTNIRAIIESNYVSCPTDSALKRHYEAMIDAEIEQYLLNITT